MSAALSVATDASADIDAGSDSFVAITGVRKDYGARRILEGVDLTLERGDFLTLVGPSGCGKSTLLRLVLGQETPTSGTVVVDGVADAGPDARRGVVYQQYTLFPHLTVLDNVMLSARLKSSPWTWRRERAAAVERAMELLRHVRLEDSAGRYPHELSGGMRQRVAIAQAVAARPAVLLMDEPFAALDSPTRRELQSFVHELWASSGMTVMFVTHDVDEALILGTRIALLTQYHDVDVGRGAGARIVMDRRLDPAVFKSGNRDDPQYQAMRAKVLVTGFDPLHASGRDDVDARKWRKLRALAPDVPATEHRG